LLNVLPLTETMQYVHHCIFRSTPWMYWAKQYQQSAGELYCLVFSRCFCFENVLHLLNMQTCQIPLEYKTLRSCCWNIHWAYNHVGVHRGTKLSHLYVKREALLCVRV